MGNSERLQAELLQCDGELELTIRDMEVHVYMSGGSSDEGHTDNRDGCSLVLLRWHMLSRLRNYL